jgi:hypothetical protein
MRRKRWTEGKWKRGDADQPSIDVYVFKDGKPGAKVVARVPYAGGHDPEAEANATLISAAPDMFDALENFIDSFSDNGEFNTYTSEHSIGDLLAIAKNALQLAKGAPRR